MFSASQKSPTWRPAGLTRPAEHAPRPPLPSTLTGLRARAQAPRDPKSSGRHRRGPRPGLTPSPGDRRWGLAAPHTGLR